MMGETQRMLCITAYILSVIWVLCFGAVSLSTGETKPRGMFVDENALSVKFSTTAPRQPPRPELATCSAASWGHQCVCGLFPDPAYTCTAGAGGVVEIAVQPRTHLLTQEATVFVFPLTKAAPEQWLLNFVQLFCNTVKESEWTTKTVIVLLVPVSGKHVRSSRQLDDWLRLRHGPPSLQGGWQGLLRSAFVVDLGSGSSGRDISAVNHWGGDVLVLAEGVNGQLPNMDMLANLQTLSQRPMLFNERSARYFPAEIINSGFVSKHEKIRAYMERMYDLFSFCLSLITGPSGLHHLFLSKNIDSVTLRLGEPSFVGSSNKRSSSSSGSKSTVTELIDFLMKVVRSDQLLHGRSNAIYFKCISHLWWL
jgi:hypothetical protein